MANAALVAENPPCTESQSLIDELNRAAAAGDAKRRARIAQRLADLFAAGSRGYSTSQVAVFDDVLRKLATDIEVKARSRLAHRLSRIDNAPPKLMRSLAFDDAIEVAEPVLIHSVHLSDADLVENAATKSQGHLLAIAQRLELSEAVTDVLIERGDRRVVHRVANNNGARISLAGYDRLTVRAREDNKLTLTLGQRSDLPRQHFLRLLETASAAVRAKLEKANPRAAAAIRDTIDDVATAMQHEARNASRQFTAAMRDAKSRSYGQPLTEANIYTPAHAQEFDRTVVALSKLGRFPVDLVERALLDEGDDMILIIAKAAGCSWTTVKELLLMSAAQQRVEAIDLERASARYKNLTEEMARDVLNMRSRRLKHRAQKNSRPRSKSAGGATP